MGAHICGCAICSLYVTALQDINNLETKRSYKRTVNLENLNFFLKKSLLSGLKIIRLFLKVDQNVYKTANKSASMQANQTDVIVTLIFIIN